jgi:CDP-diacylglycerol--serine O-phosphatidyltransferase
MKFLKLISIADMLTTGNAACGILAIIFLYTYKPDITIGSSLIIIGMIFDGLDGLAARKFGTSHDYGKYLDSVADAITFGLAPAYLFFIIFSGSGSGKYLAEAQFFIITIMAIITAGLAIYRLIKFSTEGYRLQFFTGLATPAFAFLIVITAHILDPHRSENSYTAIPFFTAGLIMIGNYLLVSNVKYPKVRGRIALVLASGFALGILSLLFLRTMTDTSGHTIFIYYRILSIIALAVVVTYVIGGPIYMQLKASIFSDNRRSSTS